MRSKKKEEEEQTFTFPYLHKQKKYIYKSGGRSEGNRRKKRGKRFTGTKKINQTEI